MPQRTIILDTKLIKGRMLPEKNIDGIRITVPHHIGKPLFCNTDQTVFHLSWNLSGHIISKSYRAEGEIFYKSLYGIFQIHRIIVKIMDTGTDAVHGTVQRFFQISKKRIKCFIFVDGFAGRSHKNGAGEHMAYIVMDFPCDPVSLPESCSIDLIILFFQKRLVFFGKKKCVFFAVITALTEIPGKEFILPGMRPEKKRQDKTKDSGETENFRKLVELKSKESPEWKFHHCQKKKSGR